jgi:hypothetical protein
MMQANFEEGQRRRIGDKHDGILYLQVHGVKIDIGFLEVVGNAFTTDASGKDDDLEKLLKGTFYNASHLSISCLTIINFFLNHSNVYVSLVPARIS